MGRASQNTAFRARTGTAAWKRAPWKVGLLSLILALTGCIPNELLVSADEPNGSRILEVAKKRSEDLYARPQPPGSEPDVASVWTDVPSQGPSVSANKTSTQPKTDHPAEKEEPLPSPRKLNGPGLTLDQAINATMLADPKIRAGLEVINQANADLLTSSLLPNPDFSFSGTLLPLTGPFTIDRQGGPPQPGADLSYPIDWFMFGKRAAAMASAAAGVRISEADYADLVRQRVTDTATGFYDVVEAKALLALARQDLENLRRVEAAIQKAVDLGGGKTVDLNRAHLDVIRSEQSLREAETTLAVAKAKLRAQMGRRDPDSAFDVTADLNAALTAKPLGVEESLALAEQYRPDIRSLRLQVDKATRDIHAEKTKAYPAVTPKIGYIRQIQQKTNGFPDVDLYEFSVDVTLPFFDRNQGNIAKARSVATQNAFNLESGRVDLRAEIVQVVQEFLTAFKNAGTVGEKQVRLAQDVRDSIEKAYLSGGRTLIEVLDAEREYRETYRNFISNRANYWRSVYKFDSAIGKQVLQHDERSK